MSSEITFRLRTSAGQKTYKVKGTDTLQTVQELVATDSKVQHDCVQFLSGYPPIKITGEPDTPINQIIHNGDSLILELLAPTQPPPQIQQPQQPKSPQDVQSTNPQIQPTPQSGQSSLFSQKELSNVAQIFQNYLQVQPTQAQSQIKQPQPQSKPQQYPKTRQQTINLALYPGKRMFLRPMLNDNSCLFHALYFAFQCFGVESPYQLRELCAQIILDNPGEYAQYLDKNPGDYAQWILREQSWGGEPELAILSKHFNVEIDSIDVKSLTIYKFGHDITPTHNPTHRCVVCYNGVHYDIFVLGIRDQPIQMKRHGQFQDAAVMYFDVDNDVALFPITQGSTDDELLINLAYEIVEIKHNNKEFVDEVNYTLRCDECGSIVVGDDEAIKHMQRFQHTKFSEVKK
ncbi:MAG: hypothetical protein EZS28_014733 [Streblomastix strix]|uniref:Ubiquitin thioesterase OTU n=1 Tax=Streblomastix strix TaxID=222440 RepID=A0A5J4W482_9EUKA|nr:MAG: hypothetical protein EZS28_014733 [Streblomastix strix]